jgi:hypothetical protein
MSLTPVVLGLALLLFGFDLAKPSESREKNLKFSEMLVFERLRKE